MSSTFFAFSQNDLLFLILFTFYAVKFQKQNRKFNICSYFGVDICFLELFFVHTHNFVAFRTLVCYTYA